MQPIITANNGLDILLTPIKAEGIEGKISVENLPAEAALKADATLTEHSGFSDWVLNPSTYNGHEITLRGDYSPTSWDLFADGEIIGSINKSDEAAVSLLFRAGEDWYGDVALIATREAMTGYVLGPADGPNAGKPLAPAGDYALNSDVNLLRAAAAVSGGTFPLSPRTSVYRLSLSGANPDLPTPGSSDIPEGDMYYCFELEVSVDSAATGTIGWPEWDWLEDPPGLSDCVGKTAYVACRLDCRSTARTITANCWRVA